MKCFILILFSICCLSACCHSGREEPRFPSLYNDIHPVPSGNFSRACLLTMAETPEWRKSQGKEVIVCGAYGSRTFKPGVSVDGVIRSVYKEAFYPSFHHVFVWKSQTAALYAVHFQARSAPRTFGRTISSAEPLSAGDVIVIFERVLSF